MTLLQPQDLPARRPVWAALSTLFLDTDVTDTRAWRAQVLAKSPYTLDELERILEHEVSPVCQANLLIVAGEWVAFDPQWLEAEILARVASRRPRGLAFKLGQWVLGPLDEWDASKAAVQALRQADRHAG